MRSLIDVVPFGLPDQPLGPAGPERDGAGAGGRLFSRVCGRVFGASDYVLLWAGSILDWQDPQTLVRAVASLAGRRDDIKLFFMGTRHPSPQISPMRAVEETMALARELGVLDTSVFFNDWVPYADRWRYLREADLGLSTHRNHLETRLSFRTRMLDYFWAGVPIVCTEGDVFASLVAERGLGLVVPPGDADALASAIERLIDDPDERARCRRRLLEVAEEFRWRRVGRPARALLRRPAVCGRPRAGARGSQPVARPSYRLTNWARRAAVGDGRLEEAHRAGQGIEAGARRDEPGGTASLLARARARCPRSLD